MLRRFAAPELVETGTAAKGTFKITKAEQGAAANRRGMVAFQGIAALPPRRWLSFIVSLPSFFPSPPRPPVAPRATVPAPPPCFFPRARLPVVRELCGCPIWRGCSPSAGRRRNRSGVAWRRRSLRPVRRRPADGRLHGRANARAIGHRRMATGSAAAFLEALGQCRQRGARTASRRPRHTRRSRGWRRGQAGVGFFSPGAVQALGRGATAAGRAVDGRSRRSVQGHGRALMVAASDGGVGAGDEARRARGWLFDPGEAA